MADHLERHFACDLVIEIDGMSGMRQHGACEVLRQGLQMFTGTNVRFDQTQECADRRIFVRGPRARDDDGPSSVAPATTAARPPRA